MSISEFSVIIPNYNNLEFTVQAIQSVYNQSVKNIEIILVDNGSQDYIIDELSKAFPLLTIIKLQENKGFSCAVNCGIKAAKGEYIALLNNDAVATSNWLENGAKILKASNNIQVVTPQILSYYDKNLIDSAGDVINIVGQAYSRGESDVVSRRYLTSKFVFSASGCAPIFRKEIFLKIGLFDEDYFAYFEDLDLSWRIQRLGGKIWYESSAKVYHRRKQTSRNLTHINGLMFRNTILCYLTNTPISLMLKRKSLVKTIAVIIHTIYFLMRQKKGIRNVACFFSILSLKHVNIFKRITRKKNTVVSKNYLDAWRIDKSLKIFGVRI